MQTDEILTMLNNAQRCLMPVFEISRPLRFHFLAEEEKLLRQLDIALLHPEIDQAEIAKALEDEGEWLSIYVSHPSLAGEEEEPICSGPDFFYAGNFVGGYLHTIVNPVLKREPLELIHKLAHEEDTDHPRLMAYTRLECIVAEMSGFSYLTYKGGSPEDYLKEQW